jgi:hypothetical protein
MVLWAMRDAHRTHLKLVSAAKPWLTALRLQAISTNEPQPDRRWGVCIGAIPVHIALPSGVEARTSTLSAHIFVKQEDGPGVSTLIHDGLPRYVDNLQTPVTSSDVSAAAEHRTIHEAQEPPLLFVPLRCHCGTFKAQLRRPSAVQDPPEGMKELVKFGDRWRWTICVCNSCRRCSGQPLSTVTYAPVQALLPHPDDTTAPGASWSPVSVSGLMDYKSSDRATRTFCGTCGALVFFRFTQYTDEDDERRWTDVIDVYLGMYDPPNGLVIAFRDWLWRTRAVCYAGYGVAPDEDLEKALIEGFKKTPRDVFNQM